MAFEVTRVQLGEMGTNGYILYDNVSGDCAFIDVGDYGERLRVFLKNKGIDKIRYILLTHGHFVSVLSARTSPHVLPSSVSLCQK